MAKRSATATFNELSEVDASGSTAEIYAELRRLTGVPVVALIYRHIATHEGLLPHIWAALQPILKSGVLQDARIYCGLDTADDDNWLCAPAIADRHMTPIFRNSMHFSSRFIFQ